MKTRLTCKTRWTFALALAAAVCISLPARAEEERAAEPTAAQQAEAEKLIKDVYKDDYAKRGPEERKALAAKLLEEGRNTKSDANSQYVLLRESRDLATQVADVETAIEAATEIGKCFKVDVNEVKLKALTGLKANVRTPDGNLDSAAAAMAVIDGALQTENFDVATKAAELAVTFATGGKNMPLVADAQARKKEITAQSAAFIEMKIALDKLKTDPKDQASKHTVGAYQCVFRNDWDKGLPMVAEGNDETWVAAAKADIANPVDVPGMVKVADAWWDIAQKHPAKSRVLARAEFWYNLCLPSADGLAKAKVEKRLETIEAGKSSTSVSGVSEATRKLIPNANELGKLKELCIAAKSGNYARQSELQQTVQRYQTRLAEDLMLQKEADFIARVKADLTVRKCVETNGAAGYAGYYNSPLWHNISQYLQQSKNRDELAARILAVEKFNASEKVIDKMNLDNYIYNGIRNFVSHNMTSFSTQKAKLDLAAFLKTKGVRSDGLERYRAYTERYRY